MLLKLTTETPSWLAHNGKREEAEKVSTINNYKFQQNNNNPYFVLKTNSTVKLQKYFILYYLNS
jgi:hypothetical protein